MHFATASFGTSAFVLDIGTRGFANRIDYRILKSSAGRVKIPTLVRNNMCTVEGLKMTGNESGATNLVAMPRPIKHLSDAGMEFHQLPSPAILYQRPSVSHKSSL